MKKRTLKEMFYDGVDEDTEEPGGGMVGAKLKLIIDQKRDEAQRMMDEADEWEKAWKDGDYDYLKNIGVLSPHEV